MRCFTSPRVSLGRLWVSLGVVRPLGVCSLHRCSNRRSYLLYRRMRTMYLGMIGGKCSRRLDRAALGYHHPPKAIRRNPMQSGFFKRCLIRLLGTALEKTSLASQCNSN
ncbi:hypothetical protein F5B22DRAFT_586498, partial [Xylaria bambusicola]|uniref:uncharacterized protein n=1 Tax=Xylaria bambusicola TaxID=326684 RepID=UPI002008C490